MRSLREGMDLACLKRHGRFARVGFVPTMGALHAGHTGLVGLARTGASSPADFTVASILVNPTQFAPHEDLSRYPRTWAADCAALQAKGVDAIFAPPAGAMYPSTSPYRTFVSLSGVDELTPEGSARPGFFRGVATIVTKLLQCVRPTEAWFGQKDGIQCIVVRTLARDLNLPVAVRIAPTAREADGLAMSSRNVYLSAEQRAAAPAIHAALQEALHAVQSSGSAARASALAQQRIAAAAAASRSATAGGSGQQQAEAAAEAAAQRAAFAAGAAGAAGAASGSAPVQLSAELQELEALVRRRILSSSALEQVQYVAFSDALTGAPLSSLSDSTARNGAVMLSVVARAGQTRLLDNIMLVGSHEDLGLPLLGEERE